MCTGDGIVEAKLITWTTKGSPAEAHSKLLLTIVEGTGDAAFAVDTAGRIRAWNLAASELFGRSETEVMSVPCHELLQCSEEEDLAWSKHCVVQRWVTDNQPPVSFDVRLQTKTGRIWCNVSTLILRDPVAGGPCAIHIVRPIEIRKRLEQALSEFVRLQLGSSSNGNALIRSVPSPNVKVCLTRREVEVLKSLAKGHTTKNIADELNISATTVKNHIKHILTKLDAHTRLEAIRRAEIAGMI